MKDGVLVVELSPMRGSHILLLMLAGFEVVMFDICPHCGDFKFALTHPLFNQEN